MDFIGAYITIFFIIFLVFPTLFMCIKLAALCCGGNNNQRGVNNLGPSVRQAPVYTIASDTRVNDTTSNFTDFFWNVPPQNNRLNEPVKDDKDLPSYEEVMRMEMTRQVSDSSVIQPSITTQTNTVETVPPVRLPV